MDTSSNHSYHQQNNQSCSGLLRFRSAPSSLLANFNDNGVTNDSDLSFQELEDKSAVRVREARLNYANSPQCYSGLPPHYPRQSSATTSTAMDSSYGLIGSMTMGHHEQAKMVDSNLARQNSSPAGLFGNLFVQNGYATMKGMGNYAGVKGTNGEASLRLKSQLSFPARVPSSLGMLLQISEIESESIDAASLDSGKLGNSNCDSRFYNSTGYPYGSWNDLHFPENFNGMKRDPDDNGKLFSNIQVRRTRISERMKKLQELVPNMDKQANTADMLDLAVGYIKDLQKQYKTLIDNRANCKCLSKHKPVQSQIV
ncbi:transcription factor bHLH130 isoform X2 [Hevea brasiliensis]|uniref:transcription factor bHLH130 isoform X2 n=1 Tax=Hevea brasiliensis TaxID=3981 RepID=UPI0025D41B54|nr:transcription factor bHLH130 isoform X2 [Hevea brasiliensis]